MSDEMRTEEVVEKMEIMKRISDIALELYDKMPDGMPMQIAFAGLLAGRYEHIPEERRKEAVFRDGTLMAALVAVMAVVAEAAERVAVLEKQMADIVGHPVKAKMH